MPSNDTNPKTKERFTAAKITLKIVQGALALAERLQGVILALHAIGNAIPPIRAAMAGVGGIVDMASAVFVKDQGKKTRAAKFILGAVISGLLVAAIAAPPVAGILLVAGFSVKLIREMIDLGHDIDELKHLNKQVAATEKALEHAEKNNDTQKAAQLRPELEDLQRRAQTMRENVGLKVVNNVLAVTSVIGVVLTLIPPLAPIGLGLLLGSAAVGAVANIGVWLKHKFWDKRVKPNATPKPAADTQDDADVSDDESLSEDLSVRDHLTHQEIHQETETHRESINLTEADENERGYSNIIEPQPDPESHSEHAKPAEMNSVEHHPALPEHHDSTQDMAHLFAKQEVGKDASEEAVQTLQQQELTSGAHSAEQPAETKVDVIEKADLELLKQPNLPHLELKLDSIPQKTKVPDKNLSDSEVYDDQDGDGTRVSQSDSSTSENNAPRM
ncbi:MAG: hypothetical protein Tsb005_10890 [Gammaproteobacteria bacterium]